MAKRKKQEIPEPTADVECPSCDGTGQLCNSCDESAAKCDSAECFTVDGDEYDEAGFYDCGECGGTGVVSPS